MKQALLLLCLLAGCNQGICNLPEPEVDSAEAYIINGDPSIIFRASVLVTGNNVVCTGTVIGPHTVLTAGHCVAKTIWRGSDPYGVVETEMHPNVDLQVVYVVHELPGPYAEIAQGEQACYPGFIAQGYGKTEDSHGGYLKERVVYQTRLNDMYIYVTEGPCFGDSGSGLYLRNVDKSLVIAGTLSQNLRKDCSEAVRGAARYINLLGAHGLWVIERIQ